MRGLRSNAPRIPGCTKGEVRDAIAEVRRLLIELETQLKTGAPRDPATNNRTRQRVSAAGDEVRNAIEVLTQRGLPNQ